MNVHYTETDAVKTKLNCFELFILAVTLIFITCNATGENQVPQKVYIHSLCAPPVFSAPAILHFDIQKEMAAQAVVDEKQLDASIHEMYATSSKYRNEYTNINDFASAVRSELTNREPNIYRTIEKITISTNGQYLQEYGTNDPQAVSEVIHYLKDGHNWQSLLIDHQSKTAIIQDGQKGIFRNYREVGLLDAAGRLQLLLFLKMLPNSNQSDAIDALCKGETLVAGGRSMKLETRQDMSSPYLVLTIQNTAIPSSVEFQLDPRIPGMLLSEKSTSPQETSQWIISREATGSSTNFVYPRKAVFEKRDLSGHLKERETIVLEDTLPSADWNIQQLWADKMNEIKDYQVSVQQ